MGILMKGHRVEWFKEISEDEKKEQKRKGEKKQQRIAAVTQEVF